MTPKEYIDLLKIKNITPNWWCSEEYFKFANFEIVLTDNIITVRDSNQQIFPAINVTNNIFPENPNGFWCDFQENKGKEFLDYEYIYNPKNFITMEGSAWSVFRKNSKKFPKRIDEEIEWVFNCDNKKIEYLLYDWINNFDDIQDIEVLIKFVFDNKHRVFLIGKKSKKIYSINVWDENYKYINYRYNICDNNYDFLSEYSRWYFYYIIENKNKLVNDGGVLGNNNLKTFKDKLNPVQVNKIYSQY